MFGASGYVTGSCRLREYITRKNPSPNKNKPNYILEIQHDKLPQESIVIVLDGRIITDFSRLKGLADAIEKLWYDSNLAYRRKNPSQKGSQIRKRVD